MIKIAITLSFIKSILFCFLLDLLKLYLNDVGLLTYILYGNNIRAILDDQNSINLGSVYENAVASELIAHGFDLYYL